MLPKQLLLAQVNRESTAIRRANPSLPVIHDAQLGDVFGGGAIKSDLERFSWCFASVVRVHRAFTGCGPFR